MGLGTSWVSISSFYLIRLMDKVVGRYLPTYLPSRHPETEGKRKGNAAARKSVWDLGSGSTGSGDG